MTVMYGLNYVIYIEFDLKKMTAIWINDNHVIYLVT